MTWKLFRIAILALMSVSSACAVLLTALLAAANPGISGVLAYAVLFLSMLWLASLLNAVFAIAVLAIWVLASRFWRHSVAASPRAFVLAGLITLNVCWALWHRLAMVHQWASVRPFVTTTGWAQTVGLALLAACLWSALFGLAESRRRPIAIAAGILVSALLAAGMLHCNRVEESRHRVYPVEALRAAAGPVIGPNPSRGRGSPIIVIGIDGLEWNVVVPLLKSGRLPSLRRLIARGVVGYLDNEDESLSPRIWMTMYTGRLPKQHGVHGFIKMELPLAGGVVSDLLLTKPALDTFYGVGHLVQRVPTLGLWKIGTVGTRERRVPAVWEIASHYGKRIAVVNPIVSLPVREVAGAIVDLRQDADSKSGAFYPADLARRWGRRALQAGTIDTDESFDLHAERFSEEVSFALELFREIEADLGIYYTHFLDTASHMNWDFYARDEFFLNWLPQSLPDGEWEKLVQDHATDRVFRAYAVVDEQIRRFADAFPNATFLIVSDHGWTYSGYEHFGSPEGVVILSGHAIRSGAPLMQASIRDITPTILALLEVPLSEELDGQPLSAAIEAGVPRTVASYAEVPLEPLTRDEATPSREEIERLRAIGYVE